VVVDGSISKVIVRIQLQRLGILADRAVVVLLVVDNYGPSILPRELLISMPDFRAKQARWMRNVLVHDSWRLCLAESRVDDELRKGLK
jgi:hypothetical protein